MALIQVQIIDDNGFKITPWFSERAIIKPDRSDYLEKPCGTLLLYIQILIQLPRRSQSTIKLDSSTMEFPAIFNHELRSNNSEQSLGQYGHHNQILGNGIHCLEYAVPLEKHGKEARLSNVLMSRPPA